MAALPLSVEAITRASARMSLLFCGTAVLSLPLALRGGWQPRAVLILAALAVTFAMAVQVFVRRGGRGWAAALLVGLCLTTALVSASSGVFRQGAAHQIVSWTNAGVGGALAFTYGVRWGAAVLILGMVTAFATEIVSGGTTAASMIAGPLTYVAGSMLARHAAFRGDAATELALAAKEDAEAALRVAEQRWEAARAAQRQLHDTVLATLTMLAHRGQGVSAGSVVSACVRDVGLLRRRVVPPAVPAEGDPPPFRRDPDDAPPAPGRVPTRRHPAGAEGGSGPDGGATTLLCTEVEAAIADGRASGLDIRVHATGPAYATARLDATVVAALGRALRECLRNARLHSGVRAADVTLIVDDGLVSVIVLDEGRGFDPAAVPADRLGLRDSVSGRLADIGGHAAIWSGKGLGTSVLLTVPVAAASGEARQNGRTGQAAP